MSEFDACRGDRGIHPGGRDVRVPMTTLELVSLIVAAVIVIAVLGTFGLER